LTGACGLLLPSATETEAGCGSFDEIADVSEMKTGAGVATWIVT
jgi:hypothetical protein